MRLAEKEELLNQVEHKVGMIKTFHKDAEGSGGLLETYEEYIKEGTSHAEMKLFLDDLTLFLDTVR